MLLSFIVMLGIYGIPAVLGAPADVPVLTTYIFKLTNWSPPLYNTAASVAIILMAVTGALVLLQQRVLAGKSFTTVAGKAFRPRALALGPWRWATLALALAYLFIVVVLPTLALIVAAFRRFLFIPDAASLFDMIFSIQAARTIRRWLLAERSYERKHHPFGNSVYNSHYPGPNQRPTTVHALQLVGR